MYASTNKFLSLSTLTWSRRALLLAVVLTLHGSPGGAWEVFYDGSIPPDHPSLLLDGWHVMPTGDQRAPSYFNSNGILVVDTRSSLQGDTLFTPRRSITKQGPLTLEARVGVGEVHFGPEPLSTFGVAVSASWGPGIVGVFSNELRIRTGDLEYISVPVDMTVFRVIRIAINGPLERRISIGLDGVEVYNSPLPERTENQIFFGNLGFGNRYGYGVSYWDYVAFSNEYLPVPEPASLLALAAGLAGMGGVMRRRR